MNDGERFDLEAGQEALYDLAISRIDEQMAYAAGYDAGKNGSDVHNCDIHFFRTPELTKAWEAGKEEWGRFYARGNWNGDVYLGTD